MSVIATVVKGFLALDQKVQAATHAGAHWLATRSFNKAESIEYSAREQAEQEALRLERLRAERAANLVEQHKKALKRLHTGIDHELDLVDGRKAQMLANSAQAREDAADWQSIAIAADLAGEAARKAAAQL